jgi:hypothetical protein
MGKLKWPKFVKETKEDILAVLRDVQTTLNARNSTGLIDASNRLLHSLGIYEEPRALYVSIIGYALGKIVEKEYIKEEHRQEFEDFAEGTESNLSAAIRFLEEDNIKKFDATIAAIISLISEFDTYFSRYVKDVLEFARLQKGAKVYEHGLSLSSVAKMLGISQWELMPKVGETAVHEHKALQKKSARERYEEVKKVMKKGKD